MHIADIYIFIQNFRIQADKIHIECIRIREYNISCVRRRRAEHELHAKAGASGNNLMVELCKRLYNLRDDMVGKFPLDL